MKGLILWFVGVCFVLSAFINAEAGWFGKKTEDAAKTDTNTVKTEAVKKAEPAKKSEKKQEKAAQDALSAKRALIDQKKKELNNTEWAIELSPTVAGPKSKKEADTVVFKDNQVTISGYAAKGFPSTNFTLSVQADGTVIWETMQTSEKAGVAFWRGEIASHMQGMRGMLSYHLDDKTIRDFAFVSISKKDIVPAKK